MFASQKRSRFFSLLWVTPSNTYSGGKTQDPLGRRRICTATLEPKANRRASLCCKGLLGATTAVKPRGLLA